MSNLLRGEATAQAGERTLTLVLDNSGWAAVEELLDVSYLDLLAKLVADNLAGRAPQNRFMRAILWGATRAHHPEMTLEECGDALMRDPSLHEPLAEVVRASTQSQEPVQPGEAKPAKKPAKAKTKSPAGS